MDFEQRLQRAVERGTRAAEAKRRIEAEQALSEEQLKRLHSQYRLQLSEYIERCLAKLPQYFPGFQFETVVSDRGWGAAVSVDELQLARGGRRSTSFSRLELVVAPFNSAHVLELAARGTIHNKEVYHRSHYQPLAEFQLEPFEGLVDLWVPEFAELYAGSRG
ncbi:MAG TPA: hypothetical protein VG056_10185 [Pirellulales bacterium]|jgi:hypothetical protein|nr:hypothetical protein [Pirellulales bacterium]